MRPQPLSDVDIEELIEMSKDDLSTFAEELKLDKEAKNRFISSIIKLQQQQLQHQPHPSSSFLSTSMPKI